MRPVLRGVIHGESLLNGAVDLIDIAQFNDALDVADENLARQREANRGR